MFSKNLKYLRNLHNMEQIDLAHKLGRKSASSISEWEKGKYTPKMSTLSELANIFNVNIDDLMNRDLSNKQQTTIAAHFNKDDLTPEEIEEVEQFIKFVKQRRKG